MTARRRSSASAVAGSVIASPAARGACVAELERAVAADDRRAAVACLEEHWLELLDEASAERLAGSLRSAVPDEPAGTGAAAPGVDLLRAVTAAARASRRRRRNGRQPLSADERATLAELARATDTAPRVAVAAALFRALAHPDTVEAREAALVARRLLLEGRDLPALAVLVARLEGRWSGGPPPAAAGAGPRRAATVAEVLAAALPPLASPESPAAIAEATFEVALLGHPRIVWRRGDERRTVSWKLRRAFKIFAYLAASPGTGASREELIEAVWGDEPEETVRKNFHPTMSYLRRALEGAAGGSLRPLAYADGVYRLSSQIEWWIDAAELERLAQEGRRLVDAGDSRSAIRSWEAAWRLYRGPFLEGYYAGWVLERREALNRIHLEVLRGLGDLLFELGELERSLDAYRSLLAIDPLEERVHLALMRIYSRQSRRDLVRHQYDRLNQLLRRELGVGPLPETAAEYHRLMG